MLGFGADVTCHFVAAHFFYSSLDRSGGIVLWSIDPELAGVCAWGHTALIFFPVEGLDELVDRDV